MDAADVIRMAPGLDDVPAVFLTTTLGHEISRHDGYDPDRDQVVFKPFWLRDIVDAIQKAEQGAETAVPA